jgi:hypothetical protein
MKRPIGVSILAVFFVGLAVGFLCNALGCILAASDDTASEVTGLLGLVVAFLLAALGLGLWDLQEDARRAAIALFAVPSFFGLVSALYQPASLGDRIPGMMFLLLVATPAAYLMRPEVKGKFDQLVIVQLKSECSVKAR